MLRFSASLRRRPTMLIAAAIALTGAAGVGVAVADQNETASNAASLSASMWVPKQQLLTVGQLHACAIVTGSIKCWGNNQYGELGNGTTQTTNHPVAVVGISNAVS